VRSGPGAVINPIGGIFRGCHWPNDTWFGLYNESLKSAIADRTARAIIA
jgi:hypothetical protein